jgi:hypothetical protein
MPRRTASLVTVIAATLAMTVLPSMSAAADDDENVDLTISVTESPPSSTPDGALPSTGSDPAPMLVLGLALLFSGGASLGHDTVTRRRRALA